MMKMQAFEFRQIIIKNLISCMHPKFYRVQDAIFHICMRKYFRNWDRLYLIWTTFDKYLNKNM